MTAQLKVSLGQHSEKGRKEINQDFLGACLPGEPQLSAKGVVLALADGISSSNVSQIASQTAIKTLLEDYYCTSQAWSAKKSAHQVLLAINSWLHAQTQQSPYRYEKDRGYVCTLSAVILKSTTAHLFHVGDTRIYRLRDDTLEQLTNDHRLWLSEEKSYLSRALGIQQRLEIDYQALKIDKGDTFLLLTDGVHEFVSARFMINAVKDHAEDLDAAARDIASEAHERGSTDNLSALIVRVDEIPEQEASEIQRQLESLPFPPPLAPRMLFDGYRIQRELHVSSRSHVYVAVEEGASTPVVIKVPASDLRGDALLLEGFLMEEWIAQRLDSAHVVRSVSSSHPRNYLYTVTEFIEGQTLRQWMIDNPKPSLPTVRGIIEQIAKGLQAFHRMEMLHQDLRPANIMIDRTGTVKIIDLGSTRVAGIAEATSSAERSSILGTAQYTAPEYFLGELGTPRSDLFSLGVIAYQMLSGRLPFGADVAKSRTRAAQARLKYKSVLDDEHEIPAWIDDVLRKATHPDPDLRYAELSEFVYALRQPSQDFLNKTRAPLLERNPAGFWKAVSLVLAIVVLVLLMR